MIVGFDFDGTLHGAPHFETFVKLISEEINKRYNIIFLLTTRDKITDDIVKHVEDLGLRINRNDMFAIGKQLTKGIFDSKAHYMKSMNMPCDLFFDNDPYEVEDFRKFGIPVLWVPDMDKNSLMWEITEGFFEKRGSNGN